MTWVYPNVSVYFWFSRLFAQPESFACVTWRKRVRASSQPLFIAFLYIFRSWSLKVFTRIRLGSRTIKNLGPSFPGLIWYFLLCSQGSLFNRDGVTIAACFFGYPQDNAAEPHRCHFSKYVSFCRWWSLRVFTHTRLGSRTISNPVPTSSDPSKAATTTKVWSNSNRRSFEWT